MMDTTNNNPYSYYKQILTNTNTNEESRSATITRAYRRSQLVQSPSSQLYNCYYTANNSNIKLNMPQATATATTVATAAPSTKSLIKILNKSYFNKQIKKFFFYFFLFYLIIYYFSYFIFDAYLILKYILLKETETQHTVVVGATTKQSTSIDTFYAYISFTYQFLCFIIYMILFWLYYKYSNTYIGSGEDDDANMTTTLCLNCFNSRKEESRRRRGGVQVKPSLYNDAVSIKSNDFSYHFTYPKQQQQTQQQQCSMSTISTELNRNGGLCCCLKTKSGGETTTTTTVNKKRATLLNHLCGWRSQKSLSSSGSTSISSLSSTMSNNRRDSKSRFNLRLFIIIISIVLFIINILLIQIYFKSNIFQIENSIYSSSTSVNRTTRSSSSISGNNRTTTPVNVTEQQQPRWLITYKYLFNDTDGVIDIILFILILYLFNLIKPLFILITTICLVLIQSIFIIIFNKTADHHDTPFKVYVQVFINIILYAATSIVAIALNYYLQKRIRRNFNYYFDVLQQRSQLYLDCLKLETLLSNWKHVNPKSVYCTLLPNAMAAATAEPPAPNAAATKSIIQENSLVEQTQFQVSDSCIVLVNISNLNESNQLYSTQELITFLDVLYPQIEQISKKYNCDYVTFDNEDICITTGLNTNPFMTLQSILCVLEICKFIEHVRMVSKWGINYSISIHKADLVYILNTIGESPQNKKVPLNVTHIFGSALTYAKALKNSCLPNQIRLSQTVVQQLNTAFLTQNGLRLQEILQTQAYLLLLSPSNSHIADYEILPIPNLTKDRLCSIQAKYNLENQQKRFLEQQLYHTLHPRIRKTATHLTEILEFEAAAAAANNSTTEDSRTMIDQEQQFFNRFETQHFLMKNRLTKHIFRKTLSIFTLKFKQHRLNKMFWKNEMGVNDDFIQSMLVCLALVVFILIIQFTFMPRTLVSYAFAIICLATPLLVILITIYYKKKFRYKHSYKQKNIINSTPSAVAASTVAETHVITNPFLANANTTLLKCTLTNNQTYSNAYTHYRQYRQVMRRKYLVFMLKFMFKLLIIALIFATHFLNFLQPCFDQVHSGSTSTPLDAWSNYYCESKTLGLCLLVILPMLCSTIVFYSIFWFAKCLLLTVLLVIQIIYISHFNMQPTDFPLINEINKSKLILQLVLFYLFLCLITFLYEALFKLDFSILEEETESNNNFQNSKKQLNKQLRNYLPKRAIKFYLFNQNASMNHYYLSSPSVAILSVVIRHAAQQHNHDLENSKEYVTIMNCVYQLLLKERFDAIGVKKCTGSQFLATCGYSDPTTSVHSNMSLLVEFLFAIQEKINDFNDKMNNSCSISASLNIGCVTEGLIHTEKPRIDNWGDGILVAEHLLAQSEQNHCLVTEDVYNILKDRYLYRPAGSFYIENQARHITIYYLLGRLIGDNIFKGRNSLPKIIRPLSFCNRMSTISEQKIQPTLGVHKMIPTNKSSISTDSGHSSSTTRNLELLAMQHRQNTATATCSSPIRKQAEVDEVSKHSNSSKCILLTQDMLVGTKSQSPLNEFSQRSSSSNNNNNNTKQLHNFIEKNVIEEEEDANDDDSKHAPIVYPETWMDAEDFNDYDADMQEFEETFIDCDDDATSNIDEELQNFDLNDIDTNKCEEILYSYFSNYQNDTFLKDWLDEQYKLLIKNFNEKENEIDNSLNNYKEEIVEKEAVVVAAAASTKQCIQPQSRVNNYQHKQQRPQQQNYNYPSSTASSNPSSPLIYHKRYRHTRPVNNNNNAGNNSRRPPPPAQSNLNAQKRHMINIGRFQKTRNNHYATTSNTSDGENSTTSGLKLSPIDLDELMKHYKTSSEQFSSVDDGDDESANETGMAAVHRAFLPVARRLKFKTAAANYDSDVSSNPLHIEEKDMLYISEKYASAGAAGHRHAAPLRGKALLNEYINLRSSLNYQAADSSAASVSSSQSTTAKCFNDRSKSLSFKSRYYAWLLRTSANSLANGNKSRANRIILDALINGTDSASSLNGHQPVRAPSSRGGGCDSEYDNYKPGGDESDAMQKIKQSMLLKKTFWSTDDDDDALMKKKRVDNLKQQQQQQQVPLVSTIDSSKNDPQEGEHGNEEEEDEDEDTCKLVSLQDNTEMSTITERTEFNETTDNNNN